MPDEFTAPGLIPDPRPAEEKEKDFTHEEVAMAVPLQWSRGLEGAPTYSIRNQDGSGSCVGQSTAKALEVLNKAVISAHPIYRRRMNFPGVGMYLQNAGEIIRKQGTTTEDKDPSQNMSEAQMNQDVTVSTPIMEPYYITIADFKDFDKIANAIELYGHCVITVGLGPDGEWNEKPVYNGKDPVAYHAICATWYFTDENGKKCLRIDESWGNNGVPTHRVITEDYFQKRGTGAMYFIPDDGKPHYKFLFPLKYGMTQSADVQMLQDILKYEGLFPKSVASTGNYFQVTAKAVLAFQRKYQVAPESELAPLAGKSVGPKTLAKLNQLYN